MKEEDFREQALKLADQLHEQASNQGITHQAIADATGLQQPHVNRMLMGKYVLRLDNFLKLCKAVGLKITLSKINKK